MRGEWIEIVMHYLAYRYNKGLSPCGESGLKFLVGFLEARILSLPMRGEWIEMLVPVYYDGGGLSLPMRGEWIEM